MILAIDIGNSFAKWKAWQGEEFLSKGKFEHGDGIQSMTNSLPDFSPDEIVYADVCDSDFEEYLRETYPAANIQQIKTTAECLGVLNSYSQPERLGIDRWLAVIEAYNLAGQRSCCVIDFGTAATLDAINENGVHIGGHIVPGLRMLRNTLPKYTGKVRFEAENSFDLGYGVSTVEAVEKGSLSMLIAWAKQEIERFKKSFPEGTVFVTGGTVPHLLENLPVGVVPHEDIVLDALKRIATS